MVTLRINRKVIFSQLGTGAILLFAIVLPVCSFALFSQIHIYFTDRLTFRSEELSLVITSLVGIIACFNWIRLRIIANESHMKVRNLWKKQSIPYLDIIQIKLIPTTYFLWILRLTLRENSQTIALPTFLMQNETELIKAIVEAASVANPNVVIDKRITEKYGFPPYGIFYQKAKTNSDR